MFGLRWRNYCCSLVRSLLLNPNKRLIDAYETANGALDAAIDALRHGKPIADVYTAAVDSVRAKDESLVKHMAKSIGYCINSIQFNKALVCYGKGDVFFFMHIRSRKGSAPVWSSARRRCR